MMEEFSNSESGIAHNSMSSPPAQPLHGTISRNISYVFVCDATFPLKMKVCYYPAKGLTEPRSILNYRLSHAHRVIDNSFGVLTSQ